MFIFKLIFNFFWITFIGTTTLNAFFIRWRAKEYIKQKPELEKGYDQIFKGILFFGNIPWIIMMIGSLTGYTHSFFEYFNPKLFNPFVLAFHTSIVLLWILLIRWIYFKKGAEFLVEHPLSGREVGPTGKKATPEQIKRILPFQILGGIIGMILIWVIDFPIPDILMVVF